MNQAFKHNFNIQKEDTTKPPSDYVSLGGIGNYTEAGHTRNICFVWLDGKRTFLNYSYLVSCEYLPVESTIILYFTSQAFIIKGINLEILFYNIMEQLTRQVVCVNARYNSISDDVPFIVNEIILKTTEDSTGL